MKRYSDQDLKAAAQKYKTRSEFSKAEKTKYNTAANRGILDEICSHMQPRKQNWKISDLLKIAKKYKTQRDFKKKR